mmetsp:Transcript_42287/g.134334  ORF Transcript_42287/g.134334 Transcript_42287/m.134334 type:complete len:203 (+) Transcript_42287:241-849(+)
MEPAPLPKAGVLCPQAQGPCRPSRRVLEAQPLPVLLLSSGEASLEVAAPRGRGRPALEEVGAGAVRAAGLQQRRALLVEEPREVAQQQQLSIRLRVTDALVPELRERALQGLAVHRDHEVVLPQVLFRELRPPARTELPQDLPQLVRLEAYILRKLLYGAQLRKELLHIAVILTLLAGCAREGLQDPAEAVPLCRGVHEALR